ncbi:hypothetical protein COO60DRAFT_1113314 [Scenedesmus sp. NREL 46B-D3]|nr:hypothetical protein COO60DRAFT_1113314 [Scenedesmus sp. NREL 46B-D3]
MEWVLTARLLHVQLPVHCACSVHARRTMHGVGDTRRSFAVLAVLGPFIHFCVTDTRVCRFHFHTRLCGELRECLSLAGSLQACKQLLQTSAAFFLLACTGASCQVCKTLQHIKNAMPESWRCSSLNCDRGPCFVAS